MKYLTALLACFCVAATASAGTFNRQPAGLIKGARLGWVSATTIKVTVGYGEDAGDYWELTATSPYVTTGYTLSGTLTPSTFQYIYIQSSSSFPSVTLTNSAVEPSWDDSYMGWYNGKDRCIGAVWIDSSGSVTEFKCTSDDTYVGAVATILSSVTTSTTYGVWNSVNCSSYIPVNAYEIRLELNCYWNGTGTAWTYYKAGIQSNTGGVFSSAHTGTTKYADGVIGATINDWFSFSRGSDRKIGYVSWGPSTQGTGAIVRMGYRLER